MYIKKAVAVRRLFFFHFRFSENGFHRMRIPLAVSCVIRRVRPPNSKFHPALQDFICRRQISFTLRFLY